LDDTVNHDGLAGLEFKVLDERLGHGDHRAADHDARCGGGGGTRGLFRALGPLDSTVAPGPAAVAPGAAARGEAAAGRGRNGCRRGGRRDAGADVEGLEHIAVLVEDLDAAVALADALRRDLAPVDAGAHLAVPDHDFIAIVILDA